jgi:RNA polymerase sigma factor (sigma-70 family)
MSDSKVAGIDGTGLIGSKVDSMKTSFASSTPHSDHDLSARFTRETEPLFDVLLRGARRLTHNDADAEDLLQDALLHAYAGFHTFQEGSNLKAWLFRILHNRWVSGYRFRQRRPQEVSADGVHERELAAGAARLPAGHRSAEAEVLDEIPTTDVRAAMDALPEGFRAAVYLADVQGFTYVETAAILDIPVGTVMSRVSRGRQRLRISLAHRAPPDRRDATALERQIA